MTGRERVERALAIACRDLAQLNLPDDGFEGSDDTFTSGVYVLRDGVQHGGPLLPSGTSEAELLVEVAEAVQYLVSYNVGDPVWPVCPVHDFGLHPTVERDAAACVCRPHHHTVALIGELA